MTGGQLPTGAATPCKEQHKNNQLRQFGLVNGFFLPVSQLLMMRRRGKMGGFVCFGLDAAAGVSVWLSTPQPLSLLAGEALGMAEIYPAFLNHGDNASTTFPFSCTV